MARILPAVFVLPGVPVKIPRPPNPSLVGVAIANTRLRNDVHVDGDRAGVRHYYSNVSRIPANQVVPQGRDAVDPADLWKSDAGVYFVDGWTRVVTEYGAKILLTNPSCKASLLATVADMQSHSPFPKSLSKGPKGQSDFFSCGNSYLPLLCHFAYFAHQAIFLPIPAPSLVAGDSEMGRANENRAVFLFLLVS